MSKTRTNVKLTEEEKTIFRKMLDISVPKMIVQGQWAIVQSAVKTTGQITASTTQCRYRTPAGNCCIIGQLISTEYYSVEFEGNMVTQHSVWEAVIRSHPELEAPFLENTSVDFVAVLLAFQEIHDRNQDYEFTKEFFLRRIEKFVETYDIGWNYHE